MIALTSKQLEIIYVANSIILEKGLQNLTIKAIARKMKFTEGAVYRHFESKQGILYCLIDFFSSHVHDRLDDVLKKNVGAVDMLKEFMRGQSTFINEHRSFINIMLTAELLHGEKKMKEMVLGMIGGVQKKMEIIFRKGVDEGSFRKDISETDMVHFLLSGIRFKVFQLRLMNKNGDIREEVEKFLPKFLTLVLIR